MVKEDAQYSQQRKKLPMHWDPVQFLSTCLCPSLAAVFSRMLLALAGYILAQRSSSLRGGLWTQLCLHPWTQESNHFPASLLLPGVYFLALASSISYSTLLHAPTYMVLYIIIPRSKLSWLCLLFHAPSLPPWIWWSPNSSGKDFSSVFSTPKQ